MGAITTRFLKVMPRSDIGVNSKGLLGAGFVMVSIREADSVVRFKISKVKFTVAFDDFSE